MSIALSVLAPLIDLRHHHKHSINKLDNLPNVSYVSVCLFAPSLQPWVYHRKPKQKYSHFASQWACFERVLEE